MREFMPDSSFIERVTFTDTEELVPEMVVYFRGGKKESFTGVSIEVFEAFRAAESAGQFYNANVKFGIVKPQEEWRLYGSAIEDIEEGDRIEMETVTGKIRRAKLKPLV